MLLTKQYQGNKSWLREAAIFASDPRENFSQKISFVSKVDRKQYKLVHPPSPSPLFLMARKLKTSFFAASFRI